ncbi:MAG: hypothetical protein NUW22_13790 [Acidobacteria bacterium]|nr:hypothetical protein [Acidobacteriota bacterium]
MPEFEAPSNTPDPSAQDATAPEPSSPPPASTGSRIGNWLRGFVLGADEPTGEDPESGAGTETPPAPARLQLTEEELERRVQSEVDRREAKRAADATAAERKRLRDEDPYGYAEAEKAREAEEAVTVQLHGVLGKAVGEYDAHTVAPLLEALPEATRAKLLAEAPAGLVGRKALITAAVAALKAETETQLRKNPAFRKQLLASVRGEEEQPDLLPATSGTVAARDGNAVLAGLAANLGRRH